MRKEIVEKLEERKNSTWIKDNIVTILFIAFIGLGFLVSSELSINDFLNMLTIILFRNAFIVLSLVIPVIAGLGLNLGIVIGAMAGQIAVILVNYFSFGGIWGLLLCFIIALPMASLFGYFLGLLYNKTKGIEIISSFFVVYFANALYQLLLLIVVGTIIKVDPTHPMINPSGMGVRMTVELITDGGLKYALDNIMKIPFMWAALIIAVVIFALILLKNKKKGISFYISIAVCLIIIIISIFSIVTNNNLMKVNKVPVVTALLIIALCAFNKLIMKTKLGQDFRSVGQNQHVAETLGINVNRTRIIATVMSTVFAAWGQIIFLQNMGTLNTYNAHSKVGILSAVSLIVGGASISKANSRNVIIGTLLFNSMLIMSPAIGETVFKNTSVSTFLTSFMVYGVILYALIQERVSENSRRHEK